MKAPDFGSIMALARQIDPQAADRLRTDSAARDRIEGALKDGGQVSFDYWVVPDFPCSLKLKATIPELVSKFEKHGELCLEEEVHEKTSPHFYSYH